MEFIPVRNVPMTQDEMLEYIGHKRVFAIDRDDKYALIKFTRAFISADCWGCTVDEPNKDRQCIFSDYNAENDTPLKRAETQVMRNCCIDDIYSMILVHFVRYRIAGSCDIYMFRNDGYRIRISYNTHEQMFYVVGYF